jgi:hypothetical protein
MAAKKESVSYPFIIHIEQLQMLLDKIKDLITVNEMVQMKIDKNHVVIYSLVGEKSNVNAFKSFIMKSEELFNFKTPLENQVLKYIIPDGKKFDRNIRNFLDFNEDVRGEFFLDDEYINNLLLKNSKLRLNYAGGDFLALNFNFSVEQLRETMNTENADFKFVLDKSNFARIKKWSQINLKNDIYYLTVKDKKLTIGETTWDLEVCQIDVEDLSITFPKKYFNSLNFPDNKDEVEVFVFDSKLLIDNEKTSLLIALELTV